MEPLPCKSNWDFAYVNGFSVFALVLRHGHTYAAGLCGGEDNLWYLNP